MDARFVRAAVVLLAAWVSMGAGFRTQNFIVEAPTKELAEEIGRAAETYRHDLAMDWLGQTMPNWSQPCPITAQVGETLGAGGATSFLFDHGEVFGWKMNIQGSHARILDSVLPHEVTHTIFATHFRRPLPRWADEGACTTVEDISERSKQQTMLIQFLKSGRGIAFSQMFVMKEYPHDVLPLYAQGYSLARYLLDQGGKHKFLEYVGEGMQTDNWPVTTKKFYGFDNLGDLQNSWLQWVKQGSPKLVPAGTEQLAAAGERKSPADASSIYRAQSEDRNREAVRSTNATLAANESNGIRPTDLKVRGPRAISVYERAMAGESVEVAPAAAAAAAPSASAPAATVAARPQVLLEWSRTAQR